jgi:light-regulated signal transduction histidine kinase (bacteriophytochrome)
MLKKSLIFSVLAISLLLAVQILWLSMVIKHEKQNYELKFKERVNAAVNSELRHRRARLRNIDTVKNKTFTTEFVSREDAKKEKSNKYAIGIKMEVEKDRKFTTIIVEDNGIGIPEDDLKKIFDQFYRVNDAAHSIKSKGFGLGLNYVKWVAEVHKGRVYVESKVGIGSRFSLVISNI